MRLRVVDDGRTLRGYPGAGFGLRGMAERAALFGGTLSTGPGEARGWRVEAIAASIMFELLCVMACRQDGIATG